MRNAATRRSEAIRYLPQGHVVVTSCAHIVILGMAVAAASVSGVVASAVLGVVTSNVAAIMFGLMFVDRLLLTTLYVVFPAWVTVRLSWDICERRHTTA